MGKPLIDFSFDSILKATEILRAYFDPRFFGMDNISADRPTLFVGNHPLFAADYPLMMAEIYHQKGIKLRALGDHWHDKIPIWRNLIKEVGAVDGSPDSCSKLMEAGEHLVVFPGGAREALKRKGEAHQLIWKRRFGFARMAIKHGYPITPFASKGADDIFHILWDSQDIMDSRLGSFLKASGLASVFLRNGEFIPPVVRGIGFSLIPKPERFYYSFGEPIDTTRVKGKYEDQECLNELREEVAEALNTQMAILLHLLNQDTAYSPLRRLLTGL